MLSTKDTEEWCKIKKIHTYKSTTSDAERSEASSKSWAYFHTNFQVSWQPLYCSNLFKDVMCGAKQLSFRYEYVT